MKQQSLRTSLFLNGLIIMLVGMGLAGFLFWRTAEQLYIDTQTENLLAQARIIASAPDALSSQLGLTEPYMQTSNAMPGIHTRVLSNEGAVLIGLPLAADTNVQLSMADNYSIVPPDVLMLREEIAAAMQGVEASAVRKVLPEQHKVLYVAVPLFNLAGEASGLVYLASPLPTGGLPTSFFVQLAGAAILAILLALFAGTLLARRITIPVQVISQGAQKVSGGDLQQEVQVPGNIRELHTLGQVFNQMVNNLRQSDQSKDAFVADVAHELRTPLTVIKGTVETLEDGAMDDLQGRGALLSAMQSETERLIRMVNDLLILTRASSGMLKLDCQPLVLAELVQQRCNLLQALADQRGIKILLAKSDDGCVLGDKDRLAQVLDNLLQNAIRYSPQCGQITIEIQQSARMLSCSVHDDGPGIPAEHQPYIFERFYRVEASRNRQGGGAGLGLAIARALLQAQTGSIEVESQPAQGTTFRMMLPLYTDCP
ncbi:MAG: HAMP domain-containing protein [Anaerolineaceae bacterium]|nr:HAMP domain-containing protein [Anaerolineaceae bacterium]